MSRNASILGLTTLGAIALGAAAVASPRVTLDGIFLPKRAEQGWPLRAPGDRARTRAVQIRQNSPPGRPLDPRAMRDMRPVMMAGAAFDPEAETNFVSEGESDTPDMRIDPNVETSPFVGVGAMLVTRPDGLQNFCTAAAIGPRTIVTAGHCFDLDADGDNDVGFNVRISFNGAGGDDQAVVIRPEDIVRVAFAPDFGGLKFDDLHDDIAVVTIGHTNIVNVPLDLEALGVPIYPLYDDALPGEMDPPVEFFLVGYGLSGNGFDGFDLTVPSNGFVKRMGKNVFRDAFLTGDDGHDEDIVEVYAYDFDPPPAFMENAGFEGPTLGNQIETLSAPGDSGAPALVHNDLNGDGMVQQGELEIFGVTSFIVAGVLDESTGQFGNWGGGSLVNGYLDFFEDQLRLCDGDLDFDHDVDADDLAAMLMRWNQRSALTDFTHDGTTRGGDLAILLANWGPCP